MTETSEIEELITLAAENGLLVCLSEQYSVELVNCRKQFIGGLVEALNSGRVRLFGELDATYLKGMDGTVFFVLQGFLCKLIPELEVPLSELMQFVRILVVQGGDDMAAGAPNAAFKKWCAMKPERSQAVLGAAKAGDGTASSLLCFALEAARDAKTSIELLSEENTVEVQIGAVIALSRIEIADSVADNAVSALSQSAIDHPAQQVRNEALVSTFAVLAKHADLDREFGRRAIESAAKRPTAETLHAIATVLWLHGKSLNEDELEIAFDALAEVNPNHSGTLTRIDMASDRLIKAGHFDQLRLFIERFIKRVRDHNVLRSFDRFRSEIANSPERFNKVIVEWFLDGNPSLCSSLAEMQMRGRDEALVLNLKKDELPDAAIEQLMLCRRVVGYLILEPVTAASVIVSVLEHGDPIVADELAVLLFDPLLLCYGGELREFLVQASNRMSGHGKGGLKEVLKRNDDMFDALNGIENLKELHPSENHRHLQRLNWKRQMEQAVTKGMQSSVLLPLVSKQTLLYGTKSSVYISGPGGKLEKTDIPMGRHSVARELPRLEFLDPEGLQLRLYELKFGKLIGNETDT